MPTDFRPSPIALFTASDGRSAGLRLHDREDVVRVRPGIYADRSAWDGAPEWDRYLTRVHAFALVRSELPFAFEAAAALTGLPLFGHPRDIHVFDPRRARSVRYGDVSAHTSADEREFLHAGGLQATTLIDTTLDLVRVLPPAFGLAVADAALREHPGSVTVLALRDAADGQRNARGRGRVAWVLDRATALSESVGESVSRAVIEWCGFPPPVLQLRHRVDGREFRTDFAWPEFGVVGEADGWGKYDLNDPDAAARHLREEKVREDLLRRCGWRFGRWSYAGALRVEALRTALLAAGLPLQHPPAPARLATVGRNPRSHLV